VSGFLSGLEYNPIMVTARLAPGKETVTRQESETTEGPLYQVIIHNDDVTPMDFVLHILLTIFELAGPHAIQVMYTAHYHGSAYVQTLPRPEAQKRVGLAHMSARLNNYPLQFSLKPEAKQ
jgi:ATP-dependent Clp protease adaptor protein ClpS